MTYVFPAVFTPDGEGYAVAFPDVEGAVTCGDTLPEALAMAEDALSLVLMDMEDRGEAIPAATDAVRAGEEDRVVRIVAHVDAYRRKMREARPDRQ